MASLVQRGSIHYLQHRLSGKIRRYSTGTESLQLAKEKRRQFETAEAQGLAIRFPGRTPIAQVVAAHVN
jgi:hypothetical protein